MQFAILYYRKIKLITFDPRIRQHFFNSLSVQLKSFIINKMASDERYEVVSNESKRSVQLSVAKI